MCIWLIESMTVQIVKSVLIFFNACRVHPIKVNRVLQKAKRVS